MSAAAILFFLAIGPFFAVLVAWVYVMWPESDPTDDTLWERRHQAHFRDQAHKP